MSTATAGPCWRACGGWCRRVDQWQNKKRVARGVPNRIYFITALIYAGKIETAGGCIEPMVTQSGI
jgi:hypothetical protein